MENPAATWSFDHGTLTEALGFAVRKLRWGQALRGMNGAPTANSSREQTPPQLHWSGIDKIGACISL
jgi:hypothetical protein